MPTDTPMNPVSRGRYSPGDYYHLLMIYVVWGSAYLGIKIGISGTGGFDPFVLQSLRLVLGAAILAGIVWMRSSFAGIDRRVFLICALSGVLFWVGGNGFVVMALTGLPSSFVAMGMGSLPLWSAAWQAVAERRAPRAPIALLAGFGGLALILWPALSGGISLTGETLVPLLFLFAAPVTWTMATALQPRVAGRADAMALASVQLVTGGGAAMLVALVLGAPWPAAPSPTAVAALIYLAVFGSALAFGSYVRATAIFPRPVVAAFAYVNPLVGLLLGWLVLHEVPEPISLVGMAIVTLSVIVTLRSATRR